MGIRRGTAVARAVVFALVAAVVPLAAAGAAAAAPVGPITDRLGAAVPNTATTSTSAQLVGAPSVTRRLGEPYSAPAPASLDSPGSPVNDLSDALARLTDAPDAGAAQSERDTALAILEGTPLTGKAYSGIPLLAWNTPAKVKQVPAGGNVVVTEVRDDTRTYTDTWLLDFADPDQPFTITYRIAELDSAVGGMLSPTPLLADTGGPLGGLHSVLTPLTVPNLDMGTTQVSRFHPGGAAEKTRLVVQTVTVKMPPPRTVRLVLDPSLRPGPKPLADVHSLALLAPADAGRLAAAAAALGFSGTTPTAAERRAAIGRLGDGAPGKQLWQDLTALDPADPGFLQAAHSIATADLDLAAALRIRETVPAGTATDPTADLTVTLLGNEAYYSQTTIRPDARSQVRVQVVNADGFAHHVSALALAGRQQAYGAIDWGRFDWADQPAADQVLAPGQSSTVTLGVARDAFQLLVGDRDTGDQASALVMLDRGPKQQSIPLEPSFSTPTHAALGTDGDVWVTLNGTDELARITPSSDLDTAAVQRFPIPGGSPTRATVTALGPQAVSVDPRGIVWATLADGNALVRADPTQTHDGTGSGLRRYPLAACPACPNNFPAVETEVPSRIPEQMAVALDGNGDTDVWFTELNADQIGLLRAAPDGRQLALVEYRCDCVMPKGIALDPDGSIWFTEAMTNRIGRLRLDPTRPDDPSAAQVTHFAVPSTVAVGNGSTMPHSIALDGAGRVWFTEEAAPRIGVLDPALARPNTSAGIREITLADNDFGVPPTPADLAIDRAGTVFWSDEYGDIVGALGADGSQRHWRPTARQSLTDQPLLTPGGDLWFTEAGASLLTRISGVTAGSPGPALPPLLTADLTRGRVSGSRVREASSVDVVVRRDGTVVASRSGLSVDGGVFDADVAGLAANDRITVTFRGGPARMPVTFAAVDLSALVTPSGAVTGRATADGAAVPGSVALRWPGGSAGADVAPGTGDFSVRPGNGLPADTLGEASWTGATVAAQLRTTAAFVPPPGSTVITSAPPALTSAAELRFGFEAPGSATTFVCSLRRAGVPAEFTPCASPQSFPGVGDGAWEFTVRAVDGAGRPGPQAATAVLVDTAAPDVAAPTATPVQGSRLGAGTVRVRLGWAASDPAGVGSVELQRSIDGGLHWLAVPVPPGATTTTLDQPTTSAQRYRLRAADTLGNTTPWVGSSAGATRIDDTSRAMTWRGRWAQPRQTGAVAGRVHRATKAGAQASLRFTGSSVSWVSTTGPRGGVADVLIDGRRVATVKLRAARAQGSRLVLTRAVAPGRHVLLVRTRSGQVDVDAFLVLQ